MNLFDILGSYADSQPDSTALVCDKTGVSLTYREFVDQCANYSTHLSSQGVTKGTKILILQGMSIELYVALLAIFRLGAVAVFIDPSQPSRFVKSCIHQIKPDALFAPWKINLLSWFWPVRWKIGRSLNSALTKKCKPMGNVGSAQNWPDETTALITFTSGSTGKPKVIARSHRFLVDQLEALSPHIELKPGQRDLCTLPVFLLANLACGVTSFLPAVDVRHPGKIDPLIVHQQLTNSRIDRVSASPAFFERLSNSQQAPLSLKNIFTGGAPVLPTLMDRLKNWAPHCNIVAVYGSSESEPISRLSYQEISESDREQMRCGRGLLVGVPVEELELKIINSQPQQSLLNITPQQWHDIQISQHCIGEVVVQGKHVLPGYVNGIGDTENKIEIEDKRWHRTGDTGFIDNQGRLWLTGRCSAIIHDHNGTLYPFCVEVAAAMLLPKITLSACVQWKSQRLLIVEGITEKEQDLLRTSLSWAKIKDVITVNKLPVDKRHNAKIDYPALSSLLAKKLKNY